MIKVKPRCAEHEARLVTSESLRAVMDWVNGHPGHRAEPARHGGAFDPSRCVMVVDSGGYRFGVFLGDWVVDTGSVFRRFGAEEFKTFYEAS